MKIVPFFKTIINSAEKAEKVLNKDLTPVKLLGIKKDWATFEHKLIVPKGANVHYNGNGNSMAYLQVKAGATFNAPNAILRKVLNIGTMVAKQVSHLTTESKGDSTAEKVVKNSLKGRAHAKINHVESNTMQDVATGVFTKVDVNNMHNDSFGKFAHVELNTMQGSSTGVFGKVDGNFMHNKTNGQFGHVGLNSMAEQSKGDFKKVEENFMHDTSHGKFGYVKSNRMHDQASGDFDGVTSNTMRGNASAIIAGNEMTVSQK